MVKWIRNLFGPTTKSGDDGLVVPRGVDVATVDPRDAIAKIQALAQIPYESDGLSALAVSRVTRWRPDIEAEDALRVVHAIIGQASAVEHWYDQRGAGLRVAFTGAVGSGRITVETLVPPEGPHSNRCLITAVADATDEDE